MKNTDQSGHRDGRTTVLGSFLKVKRENAGLSVRALAARTGVSRQELARIEDGASQNPSPRLLKRIATKGGLSITTIDFFAAAGYLAPNDLPDLRAYLCAKYPYLPDAAVRDLETFYDFMCAKYALDQGGGRMGVE